MQVVEGIRGPLDEERRASLPIQIVARWALIVAAELTVNIAPGESGATYLLLNALILVAVGVNLALMWRLRDPRPMAGILPAIAGFCDLFAVTTAIAVVDRFQNVNFLFYFPALVAFSLVFPGRASITLTLLVMLAYALIV